MKRSIHFVLLFSLLWVVPSHAGEDDYEKGLRAFRNNDFRGAVAFLERAVTERPDPAAYYMLGYSHYELRNYEAARRNFDEAYLIDPEFSTDKIPAKGSPVPQSGLDLIDKVLERSGAKRQIGLYAGIVSSSLPALPGGGGDGALKRRLTEVITDAYRFEKIYPTVREVFRRRFHQANILSVLAWLDSPTGKKMTASEVEANTPEAMRRAAAFDGQFEKMSEARKRLLERMERALRVTDLHVEVVALSLREVLAGMQGTLREGDRMSDDQIAVVVEGVRSMPRDQLLRNALVSVACMYRDLPDGDLEEGIRFYESSAGRWFNETSIKAITAAVGKASREIGERLGSNMDALRLAI